MTAKEKCKSLEERLKDGESLIVAEGYVFEFEKRGYLRAGDFVPEVVLEHPHLVKAMYEEFIHAGSDVVLAFTYYAHREKLRHIKRENILEEINRKALKLARQVADDTRTLMAGNICNTCVYDPDDPASINEARSMFKEQIEWAVEEGADYIQAETFRYLGEAKLALESIQQYGRGLSAVVCISLGHSMIFDGVPVAQAVKELQDCGAAVAGLNCHRGPRTMIPAIEEIKRVCKKPFAAIPVPYRTDDKTPNFGSLIDPDTGARAFPENLDGFLCTNNQIKEFGLKAKDLGIQYVGLCCGNCAHYTRTLAEALGRQPPASRFSADMSNHYVLGNQKHLRGHNATTHTAFTV